VGGAGVGICGSQVSSSQPDAVHECSRLSRITTQELLDSAGLADVRPSGPEDGAELDIATLLLHQMLVVLRAEGALRDIHGQGHDMRYCSPVPLSKLPKVPNLQEVSSPRSTPALVPLGAAGVASVASCR
jgi:hypothetical protein